MSTPRTSRAAVLIVVLWVVAVLAVICLALGGTVRFKQVHLRRDRLELRAREAALSALNLARVVVLSDGTAADTPADAFASGRPEDFTLTVSGMEARLFDPGSAGRWGLSDESARLNANTAPAGMLARLPGMTPAAAEAFASARRAAGAGGRAPAAPAGLTGPIATPGQLARMLTAAMDQAGLISSGSGSASDEGAGAAEPWAVAARLPAPVAEVLKYLTIYSRQRNVDASGRPRLNINTATRSELAAVLGEVLSDDQIDAIIFTRRGAPFTSVGELLTRPLELIDRQGRTRTLHIGRAQLRPVVDRLTVTDAPILVGRVNVNTAPVEVLRTLPHLTGALASAIIDRRSGLTSQLSSIGWLLDVLSDEAFAAVCPFVTTRTQQFRVYVEIAPVGGGSGSSAWMGRARGPGEVPAARTYALGVLERDGRRSSVLFWQTWSGPVLPERP